MRLYGPEAVRAGVCETGLATHSQVVERIVTLYPHLERYQLLEHFQDTTPGLKDSARYHGGRCAEARRRRPQSGR